MADKFKACSVDNCNRNADRSAKGRSGYCGAHYARRLKYGDPLGVSNGTKPGDPLRFAEAAIMNCADECIIWPYGKTSHGYGQIWLEERMVPAHRYVCRVAHGEPPTPEHEAAHGCGNKPCINKNHLRWASPAENQADRLIHGTDSRGEKHGSSRLKEEHILEIRSLKGTESQSSLAKRFAVSKKHIQNIHCGKKWSWL